MENLKLENLQIQLIWEENLCKMNWIGVSEFRDPAEVLNPFLNEFLQSEFQELQVDFRSLEFMNSSTFSALLLFMKNVNKKGVPVTFFYNSKLESQAASFKPLVMISQTLKNVKIQGV